MLKLFKELLVDLEKLESGVLSRAHHQVPLLSFFVRVNKKLEFVLVEQVLSLGQFELKQVVVF